MASDNHQSKEKEAATGGGATYFGELANRTSKAAGRASTFILAAGIVVVWGISGPLFGFSDTWQLVINTGTTIVTFLMVFLIQNSQNRDSAAIQVKLDELIPGARPRIRWSALNIFPIGSWKTFAKMRSAC
jgi:Low affinity iron permease